MKPWVTCDHKFTCKNWCARQDCPPEEHTGYCSPKKPVYKLISKLTILPKRKVFGILETITGVCSLRLMWLLKNILAAIPLHTELIFSLTYMNGLCLLSPALEVVKSCSCSTIQQLFIFDWKIHSFVNSWNTKVWFLGMCALKFGSCLDPSRVNEDGASVAALVGSKSCRKAEVLKLQNDLKTTSLITTRLNSVLLPDIVLSCSLSRGHYSNLAALQ